MRRATLGHFPGSAVSRAHIRMPQSNAGREEKPVGRGHLLDKLTAGSHWTWLSVTAQRKRGEARASAPVIPAHLT
jgi:hypothetical protein